VSPSAALHTSIATWLGSAGHCPGSSASSVVLAMIDQSADLSSDAPGLQDPTSTCNAISIGLGFTMLPLASPPTLTTIEPLSTSACAP
jgi:hypothetical protein